MDFVSAIKALEGGLYIVEPSHWKDKYESRFYSATYNRVDTTSYYPAKVYACCFSQKRTNEAAWKVYVADKKGLAERCVQFTLNRVELRKQLDSYAARNNMRVFEGNILYRLENEINGLHKRNNPHYDELFSPLTEESYLSLLLLKRPAFSYEEEVRYLFIDANDTIKKDGGDDRVIQLSWSDIVSEVKIDSGCCEEEMKILEHKLQLAGININPTKFNLDKEKNEKSLIIE